MIATTMSRFVYLAAVLLALLAGPAQAQPATPAAIAAAKELLGLKGAAQMFDPVVTGVIEQTKGALLLTNPQLSKDLTDVGNQLRNEFAPRRAEIINEAAKFYAARFSEQELKDVVAFYKSPAGQKMLTQEPLVLDETFGFVQQWQGRIGEDVMNRFRAEMKKKGHNL
ncbi:MAG: uncharacterized protein V7608_1592 [Hyphomicrobiales bacterium]|jgi:hypothetical protein